MYIIIIIIVVAAILQLTLITSATFSPSSICVADNLKEIHNDGLLLSEAPAAVNSYTTYNPDPRSKVAVNFGSDVYYLHPQYTEGGVKILNKGSTINAYIDETTPNGVYGQKQKGGIDRNRNEISIQDYFKQNKNNNNIQFTANVNGQGAKNTKNKIVNMFQIKPDKSRFPELSVGVKDGVLVYKDGGKNSQPITINGKPVKASDKNKFDVKTNNGKGTLYVNGQKVHQFDYSTNSNLKFGLESSGPKYMTGKIGVNYSNVKI